MIVVRADTTEIAGLADLIAAAGKRGPRIILKALNATGMAARKEVGTVLPGATGLSKAVITRALKRYDRATMSRQTFTIKVRGGNIRLKYFDPRETKSGVSAAPRGKRGIWQHTFIKGGAFPRRKQLPMNGHVLERTSTSRWPIQHPRSGVFIPQEFLQGKVEAAFYSSFRRTMGPALEQELRRLFG